MSHTLHLRSGVRGIRRSPDNLRAIALAAPRSIRYFQWQGFPFYADRSDRRPTNRYCA
jgi:hypothetical protein